MRGLCRTPLVEWNMARKSRSKPGSRSRSAPLAVADSRLRHVDLDPSVVFASPSSARFADSASDSSSSGSPAGCGGGSLSGRVEAALADSLWRVRRPGWAQAGWWDAELRPELRALLWVPVGLELQQALTSLADSDRAQGHARGHCPFDHTTASLEDRVGVPGSPCACQVATVAAWAAVASWVAAAADQAVIDAAGAKPVEDLIVATRPDLGTITDPAVEDLASALRVSPGSARYRLGHRHHRHRPRCRDRGGASRWGGGRDRGRRHPARPS